MLAYQQDITSDSLSIKTRLNRTVVEINVSVRSVDYNMARENKGIKISSVSCHNHCRQISIFVIQAMTNTFTYFLAQLCKLTALK
jgi:hypothetical protein